MEARGVDVQAFDFNPELILGERKRRIELLRLLREHPLRCDDSL